ncbi:MAG: hypothetical protein M1833_004100 [Piccolia ochrophora]|nr:MAG: hypothetical protein M1833_004100 [Piccolia ochrophora]
MAKEEVINKFEELSKQNKWAETILIALSTDGRGPDIIERLQRGDDAETIARHIENNTLGDGRTSPSQTRRPLALDYDVQNMTDDISETGLFEGDVRWTGVTQDISLVTHLLDLYFTWVHPTHMLLSESHFRRSFNNHRDTYCSSALVNAICASACHLLRSSPQEAGESEGEFEKSLKEQFLAEARTLIPPTPFDKVTTVQSLAVMSLVEAGSGNGLRGSSYIKLASSSMLSGQFGQEVHEEVWQITLWGVQTLTNIWTEFTYENAVSQRLQGHRVFEGVSLERDNSMWRFYRFPHDQWLATRPSLAILTACELAKFAHHVRETTGLFYVNHRRNITARKVLTQYKRYLAWKENLPAPLSIVDSSPGALPHFFFLHVHYYTSIVHLFRPFVELDNTHGDVDPNPRKVAIESAQAGMRLLEQYQRYYTNRYQPLLQVFCLIHLADFLVRYGPPDYAREAALFCFESLKQAHAGSDVCGPLQEMFRQTVRESGMTLPDEAAEYVRQKSTYTLDDMMDAYTQVTYAQPVEQIQQLVTSTLGDDWNGDWNQISDIPESLSTRSSTDSEKFLQIRSLLND